ncbi:MAG: UDP-N-acetylglucosamine 1-carboxyvinyltransferase [Clostridium sp.]|nr:UDP-N-acetylglucosamine 1-carboxyvinyltransferase [Clostridium sp.]MCM1173086.1 UDP-N-acetylglucosamine 1-carboxyvinyltransferase [Clostridium sp.]MCM1209191.1 UDP-N-acetylglucosamine 1-carboxyvinyltransferase [Ruminococcus sp.]
MEKYVIKGGNALEGEVTIAGAKNAALGILAAAVLTDDECIIENVPYVEDTKVLLRAIEAIGAKVKYIDTHTVSICGGTIENDEDLCVTGEYIRKIRASYYLLGALLGKFNRAQVALPGGCEIGLRPIDQHIKGFEALGANVCIDNGGNVVANAERLVGSHVYMDVVTVGATINIMLAAVLAEGKTTIENAAKEPHIVDVANFLNSMGANIKGAGTDVIRIRGVQKLKGTEYSIIPDQIEAGTFMTMAVATKGNILIKNVIPKHLEAITSKLNEIGARVIEYDDAVRVMADGRLKPTQVKTLPYPGFPTDMQPQMVTTLALSQGTSVITESIFENRFRYVAELARMGAKIKVEGNSAVITGMEGYKGADLVAPDLRAGAALVIAALAAEGFSTVEDIKYILRGYENFDEKIRALGGEIQVVDSEKELMKFKLRVG